MPRRTKRVEYNGFPGGLCSIRDGEVCLPTQLRRADNVVVGDSGAVRKRPAVTLLEDDHYLSDFIIDLFSPYLSCHDKKIYTTGALVHTYSNGGLGQFQYMDGYIHTNGNDAMIRISGISAAAVLGAPLSRVIHRHNDRCFCALNNVLYETAVGTWPSSSADNFADGATWTIGDSGQKIIGLGSIGRNLFIFKQREIHIQVGYTKSERQTYCLTKDYGCVSPDTIKSAELEGVGPCVIFLSDAGKLCAVTMNGVIEVGECVQDILDSIYFGPPVNEKTLAYYMHRARAIVHPDGYYLLGFATTNDDTYDAFDQCLCLSLKYSYDSQFGRRWPFTLWKNLSGTYEREQYWNCFDYVDINTFYGFRCHVPVKNASGYSYGELSYVVSQNFANTDTSKPDGMADRNGQVGTYTYNHIYFAIRTRAEDLGSKDIMKQWCDLRIKTKVYQISDSTSGFIPLSVTQYNDLDGTIYGSTPIVNQENISINTSPFYNGGYPKEMESEFVHPIVGDSIQTSILLESFADICYTSLEIRSIVIEFLRSYQI